MATLNPYAPLLAGKDPLRVISETPQRITTLFKKLGPEGFEQSYAPGKWCAREVVCHLADTEIAFAFRLRQAAAETDHLIQPFDQDAWAKPYAALTAQDAVDAFSAFRRWNLAFLKTVPSETWSKSVTHPERGTMTFRTVVETMSGHDLNHLKQLETIAGQ
jgi:hypothetical protein